MLKNTKFSQLTGFLLGVILCCTGLPVLSQSTNDGPIRLEVRVGQVYARDYEDVVGQAENTWKFWAQDNANLDGQAWRGGQCITFDASSGSFPFLSPFVGTVLMDQVYGASVPSFYQLQTDSYEDDCSGRCSFDTGFFNCAGDNDDARCQQSNFSGNIPFRTNAPGQWNNDGFFFACGGQYGVRTESRWRYTTGDSRTNPYALGSVSCDPASFSHLNSTVTYTNSSGSPSASRDVYYQISIGETSTINATTCAAATNFDTHLYLVNSSGTVVTSNNNATCSFNGNRSTFNATNLAPGTYYVVVEGGTSAAQGVFDLSVNVTPTGASVTFTGLPATACENDPAIPLTGVPAGGTFAGPGVSGSSFNPAAAGLGTKTVTYDVTGPGFTNYSVSNIPFVGISGGGTTVSLGDNANTGAVPLGFSFPFYGNNYSSAFISSNGYISFGSAQSTTAFATCLGSTASPNNHIAFYHTNLDPGNGLQGNGENRIWYTTVGAAPNREFRLTFWRVDQAPNGNNVFVRLRLFEATGNIETHIQSAPSDGSNVTIGIENSNASLSAGPISCSNPGSITNRAYRFTPPAACGGTATGTVTVNPLPDASFTAATSVCSGGSVSLNPTIASGSFSGTGVSGSTFNSTGLAAGNYTVTYSVTLNGCNNSSTRTIQVLPPVALTASATNESCPNANNGTASASASGGTGINYLWSNGATAANLSNLAPGTYSVTATNSAGCTASQSVTVGTGVDTQPPTALCQNTTVQLDAAGNASVTANAIGGASTDNCSLAGISVSPSTFGCSSTGPNSVTLTATDGSQNTASCVATVTVEDITPPNAVCRDVTMQLDASGQAGITTGDVNNGSTDNCGISGLSLSISNFDCSSLGANPVVLSVVDESNNLSTCTGIATIIDNNIPVITCPGPVTVSCLADVPTPDPTSVTTLDNCVGGSVSHVGDIDNGGSGCVGNELIITRTYNATDASGNNAFCTQTITVVDTAGPMITCPADVVVACGDSTEPAATGQATATDNCMSGGMGGGSLTLNYNLGDANGSTIITYCGALPCIGQDPWGASTVNVMGGIYDANITLDNNWRIESVDYLIGDLADFNAPNCIPLVDGSWTSTTLSSPMQSYQINVALPASSSNCYVAAVRLSVVRTDFFGGLDVSSRRQLWLNDDNFASSTFPTNCAYLAGFCLQSAGGGPTINSSDAFTAACGQTGTITRTWTAEDVCGNTSSCVQQVTIEDNVAPVISCPADINVNVDANACDAEVTFAAIATDDCSTPTLSYSIASGSTFQVGTTAVTATATDACGNTSDCTFNVTVTDDEAPAAICQDITVQLTASGQAMIVAADVDGGSNDNCGPVTVSIDNDSFDCSNVGVNTVTLTVADTNTNTSTCTAVVTVEDNVDPIAVCQDITVQLDASGNAMIVAADVDGGSSDNCGPVTLSIDNGNFDCANTGNNPVVLTVTDANGNSSNCTATVTISDTIAPVITCPADLTVACIADTASPFPMMATATDNCPGVMVRLTNTSDNGGSGCAGMPLVITNTYTATDASGNMANCTQTITIEDTIAPVITCPADVTVACGDATDPMATGEALATDECADCGTCGGTLRLTYALADENGNEIIDYCGAFPCIGLDPWGSANASIMGGNYIADIAMDINWRIEAVDFKIGDASSFSAPYPSTVDASWTSVTLPTPLGSFNVNAPLPPSANDCYVTAIRVAIVRADFFGGLDANSRRFVYLYDGNFMSSTSPTASPFLGGFCLPSTGGGGTTVTFNDSFAAACGQTGVITRTWTATDACGNASTCDQVITIEDNIAPVVSCPADITVGTDSSLCGAEVTYTATATDTCGNVNLTYNPASGSVFQVGTTPVTVTGTDECGNAATCTFNVTVTDDEAPAAICQDITVQLDASGQAMIVSADVDGGSNDNCGPVTVSIDNDSFDCSNVGVNTVTLTVADTNNNTSTCTAIVTVEDNVDPIAVCQDITVQLDASGNAMIVSADVDGGSSDNCGPVTLSIDNGNFDCANTGNNPVVLTVTDANGNSSSCTATVTISDTIAPVITCPADLTVACIADTASPFPMMATATDNCPGVMVRLTNTSDNGGSGCAGMPLVITNTYTATDASGNTAVCSQTITVEDTIAPMINCPADVTVACGDATDPMATGEALATDNCADCGTCGGTLRLTYALADENGNEIVDYCGALPCVGLDPWGSANASIMGGNYIADFAMDINWRIEAVDFKIGDASSFTGTPPVVDASWTSVTLPIPLNSFNVNAPLPPSANDCYVTAVRVAIVRADFFGGLDANSRRFVYLYDGNFMNSTNPTASPYLGGFCLPSTGGGGTTVSFNDSFAAACGQTGVITRTWTATDACGNASTCDQVITIEDNIAPVVSCPADITVGTDSSLCGAEVTYTATGTDACGNVNLTYNPASGSVFQVGTTPVTVTGTDECGNAATCTFNVTVTDDEAPAAICQDITVQLDANGQAMIVAADVDGGSSDNCGPVTVSIDNDSFDCSNVGVNTVTLTVADTNNNTSTCTATVTVEDNVDPTAVCQDITVQLDANGNAMIVSADVDGGSSDNCGPVTVSIDNDSFDCSNVGANTVTLTVTDANGNTSTCTATVTVEDNVDPTAVCQDITVQLDANGQAMIVSADVDGGSSDNCGPVAISIDNDNFDCSNVGANTVTLTVTDANGNTSICTATVTVEDNVAPVAVCQDITVQLDANGNAMIVSADVDGGSSDNCGPVTVAIDSSDFDCEDVGANTVILTVTDVNGNTSTCTAVVTVEDTIAPTIVCPADITVNNDPGICGAMVSYSIGATDNCGGGPASGGNVGIGSIAFTAYQSDNPDQYAFVALVDIPVGTEISFTDRGWLASGGFRSGEAVQVWTATTAVAAGTQVNVDNGNSSIGSMTNSGAILFSTSGDQVIAFLGTAANPTPIAAIQMNGSWDANAVSTITSALPSGLVDGLTAISINPEVDNAIYNCTVTSGNATDLALAINDASNWTTSNTPNLGFPSCNFSLGGVQAVLASGLGNGSTFPVGTTTETYTLTDASGNTDSCSFDVTVIDNEAPNAICDDITVQLDAQGVATITINDVDDNSTDNCAIASLSIDNDSFDCSNVGPNSVVLTVVDVNNNTSVCTATVTVEDNTDPTAVCQDITVQLDASGSATVVAAQLDGGSSDLCGPVTVSIDNGNFNCSSVGTNAVTLTVTDGSGNTSTCIANVTVEDTLAPVISCPVDIVVNNDTGVCGALVNYMVNISDNCAGGSTLQPGDIAITSYQSDNPDNFSFVALVELPVGTEISFTDDGWLSSGSFRGNEGVQVWTATAPVAAGTSVNFASGIPSVGTATNPGAILFSSSGDQLIAYTGTASNPTPIAALQMNGSWDNSATSTTTSALPTGLVDGLTANSIAPEVDNAIYNCAVNSGTPAGLLAAINDASNWITSSSGGLGFPSCNFSVTASLQATLTAGLGSGSTFPVGTTTETYIVTDASGNADSCSFTVTVNDTEAPAAICQDITVQLNASGNASIVAADVDGGSNDNCGVETVSIDNDSFDCSNVGANTVALTVTDSSGNSSTCNAIVTVEDNVDPIAVCQDITVQLDANGQAMIVAADVDGGSSDNCGLVTVGIDNDSFDCSNVGVNTVTLTVTDANVNTSTCTATVTVEDNVDPIAVCQDITVQLDASGNAMIVAADVDGGSSDNCGPVTLSLDNGNFDCATTGNNPVVLTVTDANGNSSSCTATVTVADTIAPVITCPADLTVACLADTAQPFPMVATATDNCPGVMVRLTNTSDNGGSGCTGSPLVITNTYTATDASGNIAVCDQTITVEDTIAPVINCPADVIVACGENTDPIATGDALATDNCADCGSCGGSLRLQYGLADANGNEIIDYCGFVPCTNLDPWGNVNASVTGGVYTADVLVGFGWFIESIDYKVGDVGAFTLNGSEPVVDASWSTQLYSPILPNRSISFPLPTTPDDCHAVGIRVSIVKLDFFSGPDVNSRRDVYLFDGNFANSTSPTPSPYLGGFCVPVVNSSTTVTYVDGFARTCGQTGIITRTWTATDACGNASSCDQLITIIDTVPPVVTCPADITVGTDNGLCSAVVNYTATAMDACGPATLASTPASGSVFQIGTTPVMVTGSDACGNTASCSFNVTVSDDEAPAAICQDITVQLDASGQAMIVAADVDGGSSDNCGPVTVSIDNDSFDCSNVGVNTVTLTVADTNTNTSTCTAIVTVEDNVDPTAVCQDITVQLDASGNAMIVAADVDGGSIDNCGPVTISIDNGNFDCANTGNNPVVLTVTDANGNSSSCTATVTVADTIAPVITCPADLTVACIADTASPFPMMATATDNCPGVMVRLTNTSDNGGSGCAGMPLVITNTYTATDASGNTAVCSQTITVEDTIAPMINCPADVTVACGDATDPMATGEALATDNCADCGTCGGTLRLTYALADENGNEIVDYCGALPCVGLDPWGSANASIMGGNYIADFAMDINWRIEAVDFKIGDASSFTGTPPVVDASWTSVTLPIPLNSFNVNAPLPPSANDCYVAAVRVAIVRADFFGGLDANSRRFVYLYDGNFMNSTNPTASPYLGGFCLPSTGGGGTTVSFNDSFAAACGQTGVITRTWTATDACGNASTCDQMITIEDNIAPVVSCPADITVGTDSSLCGAEVTYTATGTDACGNVNLTYNPASGSVFQVGTTPVTVTGTDECGNAATCTFNVTVTDDEAPAAICQDITVQLDANGQAMIVAADVDGGSNDNCGPVTVSIDNDSFDCSNVGVNTVTLTVADTNNNTSTCTAVVTVEDNVDPIAVCQDITVQLDASGNAMIVAADVDGGSSDNCGPVSVSIDNDSFDCSNVGANTVTLTVTDANGNTSTCTATVTVEDNVDPTAVCQDITVQLDANGQAMIVSADVDGGSNDNCGPVTISIDNDSFDCSNVGANTVTLTVTDANGNTSTCTATVTVQDNVDPTAVCQDVTVYLDQSGQAMINTSDINNGSSDNCAIDSISVDPGMFNCDDVGSNPVTLTVTDASGNTATCTASVEVLDTINPTAVCQDLTVYLDAAGAGSITAADVDGGSTDNCDIASLSIDNDNFDCDDVGANTANLTVTDVNGNVSTCSSIVTVLDTIDPTAVCQDLTVFLNDSGFVEVLATDVDGGSFDNCGIATIAIIAQTDCNSIDFTCADVGVNTVTLLVQDINRNSDTCEAMVTVIDSIAPEAICQDVTVYLDQNGQAVVTGSDIDNGSSDNCAVDSLWVDPGMFDCDDIGSNGVTLTVVDVSGNSSTCSATVEVIDTIAPTAVCQDITVTLDASGTAVITAADVNGGSYDNCAIDTIEICNTVDPCNVIDFDTDGNGNPLSAGTSITTQLQGYGIEVVGASGGINQAWIFDTSNPTGGDNDLGTPNGSFGGPGVGSGGATNTTPLGNVLVIQENNNTPDDNWNGGSLGLTFTNPSTITYVTLLDIEENGGYIEVVTANGTVTIPIPANGNNGVVTVPVNVAGAISMTVYLTGSGALAEFELCGETGGCSNMFTCADIGVNQVVLTVTDVNGLQDSCVANVTIEGASFVEIVCPGDIITSCDNSNGGAHVTWTEPEASAFSSCEVSCSGDPQISGFIYMGEFDGHRYYCSNGSNFDWDQANTAAQAAGGYLASINSAAENQYIQNLILANYVWIGLNDVANEGTFEWRSGDPVTYTNWQAGDPNNAGGNCFGTGNLSNADYAALRRSSGTWYDRNGCNQYEFVMEVPCSGSVTVTQIGGPANGSLFPEGTTVVTYVAEDNLGNTDTCSFNVTVEDCTPVYCDALSTNSQYEWIDNVSIGTINNTSGNDNGYGDYTNLNTTLTGGSTVTLNLSPGFAGTAYDEYWRVWVDWNRDGDFTDAGEVVFSDHSTSSLSGSFVVPTNAASGAIRMRIAMRWDLYAPASCCTYSYGEVEDYHLNVVNTTSRTAPGISAAASGQSDGQQAQMASYEELELPSAFEFGRVYPNPLVQVVSSEVNLEFRSGRSEEVRVVLMDLNGRVMMERKLEAVAGPNRTTLDVSKLSVGTYLLKVAGQGATKTERLVIQ